MKATNYNIHDVLKVQLWREREYGWRDQVNLKLSAFEVDRVDNPDIVLRIGRFTPSLGGCHLIDHQYYVKDGYLYCRDSSGRAVWEVEISGWDAETTIMNIWSRVRDIETFVNPDYLPHNFLRVIIEYKLAQKRYFMLHSAGVSKDGQAHLLASRGGAFKTSLCLDFARQGYGVLGDDRVILHDDDVLSFPYGSRVFNFMVQHLTSENDWGLVNKVRLLRYLKKGKSMAFSPVTPTRLKSVFFLVRGNGEENNHILVREVKVAEAVDKLAYNNQLEDFMTLSEKGISSAPFFRYRLACSFVLPRSKVASYEENFKRGLAGVLDKVSFYQVELPPRYTPETFQQVKELIEHEARH